MQPNDKKAELPSRLFVNGKAVTEPTQVVKELSTFFARIGGITSNSAKSPHKPYKHYLGSACTKSMAIIPVTSTEVELIVKTLKVTSASGFDRIHTKTLKAVLPSILEPLTYLINLSLRSGVFPSILKKARIIPLHKGGSHDDPSNFRPISILSVFSKVFERPLQRLLHQFLEKKGFFNSRQFGFRPGHSTEDALASLSLFINRELDSGLLPAAILIDIKKAFDSMDHTILPGKLQHIGVRGIALQWFESYLQNRCIYIGDDPRNDTTVKFGVPQGSILGPLLFLIHVNDLTRILNPNHDDQKCCNLCFAQTSEDITNEQDELITFADDTTITCCGLDMPSLQRKLENIIEETYLWMDANKLVINVEKSCILLFSRVGTLHPEITGIVTSRGKVQRPVNRCAKYLGVIVDENLSFLPHIHAIELRLSWNLGIMKKLKQTFPRKTLTLLYNALIRPHLQYCAMVWQSTFKSHLKKLDSIHKNALKIIKHTEDYLSLKSLFELSCLVFAFRFLSGLLPPPFRNLFSLVSEQRLPITRLSAQIHIRNTPTVRSDFSPDIVCAKAYNTLPLELRDRSSLGSFKKSVKNYFVLN